MQLCSICNRRITNVRYDTSEWMNEWLMPLTGAVRRVFGDRQCSSFWRAAERSAALQAAGRAAARSQVCRQLHRLLLVQREVSSDARPPVPLWGAEASMLRAMPARTRLTRHCRRQLLQRRDADHRHSSRQRVKPTHSPLSSCDSDTQRIHVRVMRRSNQMYRLVGRADYRIGTT